MFDITGRKSYRNNPEMSKDVSREIFESSDRDSSFEEPGNRRIVSESAENNEVRKRFNQRETETNIQSIHSTTPANESFLKTIFIFIIITIFFAIYVLNNNSVFSNKQNLDDLKQIFPNQPNETFENFEAVIDDILYTKEIHPAVFLFLYEGSESKVNHLVHHLAKYASDKLESNKEYIDVSRNEFHRSEAVNDYGYLLDKYKSDLLNKKVMVVKNLQNIPAHVAQVFHSFCDEISPLVEKVVYIFTLKVNSIVGKEEKIAETNLKRLWNDLDIDILMPLITRVTSTVLKVSN